MAQLLKLHAQHAQDSRLGRQVPRVTQGTGAHSCNPSTWKVEAGEAEVQGPPWLHGQVGGPYPKRGRNGQNNLYLRASLGKNRQFKIIKRKTEFDVY